MTLTVDVLKHHISYDPSSGEFRRLRGGGGQRAGDIAGGIDLDGYRTVSVLGRRYRAARLAWLYVMGVWPAGDVDHENRVRHDDRWCNLRQATRAQNSANALARSGMKGACWVGAKGKWKAQIRIAGKNTHIGYFPTQTDAHEAYKAAALAEFGEFATW